MYLHQIPVGHHFTFTGFPKAICKVIDKNMRAVKVEELLDESWYTDALRQVEYPLPDWRINFYEKEKNILQSKL